MSEEQLKAAEAEATAEQVEGSGEEISELSEDDLAGVAGGGIMGELGCPDNGYNGGGTFS